MSVNNSAVNRRGGEEGDGGGTAEVISLSRRILIIIDPSVGPRCLNSGHFRVRRATATAGQTFRCQIWPKYFEELSQTARRPLLIQSLLKKIHGRTAH